MGQLSPRCPSACLPMITTTAVRSRLCRHQCQCRDAGGDQSAANRSISLALGHYALAIQAVNGRQFTPVLWVPQAGRALRAGVWSDRDPRAAVC